MKVEIRDIKPEEIDQLVSFLGVIFPWSGRDKKIEPFYKRDSSYKLEQSKIYLLNNQIVSHVRISDREMRIGKSKVSLGPLGWVATHPEHRHRGYVSILINNAISYMEERDHDLSMLFTGGEIRFLYEKFGWVTFAEHTFKVRLRKKKAETSQGYKIEKFDKNRDLKSVVAIYEEANYHQTGSLVRSRQYWQKHFLWIREDPNLFLVARNKEDIVGYVRCRSNEESITVLEAGYKKEHTPVLKDLSSTLVNFALSRGITSLEGRFPFDHPLIEFFAEENEVKNGETDESNTMMMRITNLNNLFKKIVPELEDRIKNFPWEGVVKISTERGDASLKIKEGKIDISKETRGDINLPLTHKVLLKIVMGYDDISKLVHLEELGLSGGDTELMEKLFPKENPVYWLLDHA